MNFHPSMMYYSMSINDLPNELVLQILLHIPTASLLPHATISRRFHDLIARVVRLRLCAAATAISQHTLLLECYEPAARLTEPRMDCLYLDSPGLQHVEEGDDAPGAQFRRFKGIYSRFRPYRHEDTKPRVWKHPAGDVPGTRTFANTNGVNVAQLQQRQSEALAKAQANEASKRGASEASTSFESSSPEYSTAAVFDSESAEDATPVALPPLIQQQLHLDCWERFAQLVVSITLKMGPPRGLFARIITVRDGFIRVFRDWLGKMSTQAQGSTQSGPNYSGDHPCESKTVSADLQHIPITTIQSTSNGILWLNEGLVGIKFCVYERKWPRRNTPILVEADEELPVTYVIEYEELLVQTLLLMDKYENFRHTKDEIHNKAIVWGVYS